MTTPGSEPARSHATMVPTYAARGSTMSDTRPANDQAGKPRTTVRHVRTPDGAWARAAERASSEGRTITSVVAALLVAYADGVVDV